MIKDIILLSADNSGMDIQISVKVLVWVLSSISVAITAITLIYKYLKKFFSNMMKEDIACAVKEETENIKEDIKGVRDSLEEFRGYVREHFEQTENSMSGIRKTLKDDVRHKIYYIHKECMKADYIDDYEWYIVQELYNDYDTILQGNSFVSGLVEDLDELHKKSVKGKSKRVKKVIAEILESTEDNKKTE